MRAQSVGLIILFATVCLVCHYQVVGQDTEPTLNHAPEGKNVNVNDGGHRSTLQMDSNSQRHRKDFVEGTRPAWIGRDGHMRVASSHASPDSNEFCQSGRSELIGDQLGIPIFDLMQEQNVASRTGNTTVDHDLIMLEELVPSFRQIRLRRNATARLGSAQPAVPSTKNYEMMSAPSLTYADGSDIFKYDFWSPPFGDSPPPSNVSYAPEGCYFFDSPTYLVCSGNFTEVPELPPSLITFEMNHTLVSRLDETDFPTSIVWVIKLDYNNITNISPGAFRNVKDLYSLSLEHNAVQTFNFEWFAGSDSILVLSLRSNLINLTLLGEHMPHEGADGGSNSVLLTNLVYLNLAENPLSRLNEFIFWRLRQSPIEELNLQSCDLSFIHPGALMPLTSLRHIDLFNNSKLFVPGVQTLPLPMTLKRLGLGLNRIIMQDPMSFFNSSEESSASIDAINLSRNFYFRLSAFHHPSLFGLSTLILDDCSVSLIAENAFQNLDRLKYLYLGNNRLTDIGSSPALPTSLNLLSIRQSPQSVDDSSQSRPFMINLNQLPNLMWLDVSYLRLEAVLLPGIFSSLNNLRVLQMRRSGIQDIVPGTFSTLNELMVLDLGENGGLTTLENDFAAGLTRLMALFLDHCSLDFSNGERDAPYSPFAPMEDLVLLFMNSNNIKSFEPELFFNLPSLQALSMNDNKLTTWPRGTTGYLPRSPSIDISNNRIQFLPNQTFEEFYNVYGVDFSDNAFICNCQTYDIQLLANRFNGSNVTVINWETLDAYQCIDSSNISDPIIKYIQLLSEEEFYCESRIEDQQPPSRNRASALVASIFGSVLLVTLVGGAAFGWHYKRKVNRVWGIIRADKDRLSFLARSNSNTTSGSEVGYEYDAFISFNEQDRAWVYEHLVPKLEHPVAPSSKTDASATPFRLCLHDRDFIAGQRITENIIDNIAKSRKVVIVMSRSYVESKWCQFELNLSQHRLFETERRDALILVLLEEVPKQQQSSGLRYLISTRTYLAWQSDLEGQQLFWRRLYQVLDSDNRSHPPTPPPVHTT